jgi:predicted lipid-binding transport protein (Tim44 family)
VTPRPVIEWLMHIQRAEADDLAIVEEALTDIIGLWSKEEAQHLLNLLTAVRLDQMAKENS